uniref:rRNA-processing protein FCF1 homolog n=3 Tax=Aves TaxID=8782 RepID=A0A669PP43_PHACC
MHRRTNRNLALKYTHGRLKSQLKRHRADSALKDKSHSSDKAHQHSTSSTALFPSTRQPGELTKELHPLLLRSARRPAPRTEVAPGLGRPPAQRGSPEPGCGSSEREAERPQHVEFSALRPEPDVPTPTLCGGAPPPAPRPVAPLPNTPLTERRNRYPLPAAGSEGKQKKARKYAVMKRMISLRDQRINEKERAKAPAKKKEDPSAIKEREVPQHPSCLFFQYNTQLGPPYHILVDTNFINFSIKAKLDLVQSMMDCLYAKCIPCITDCVMAEIEKLGQRYRVALRIAKDPRFERLPCMHKGTYADDCLVQRVTQHKCYIVATVDKELKRRIRKIPGVPIMYISRHRYNIERMPDDYGAPRF